MFSTIATIPNIHIEKKRASQLYKMILILDTVVVTSRLIVPSCNSLPINAIPFVETIIKKVFLEPT